MGSVLGLRGKLLVVGGGYRGGFCEKLPEASPMSHKASASWLWDGPGAGQGQANQRWWQHLCDNIVKKGKKKLRGDDSRERGARRCERNNSADTKVTEEGAGRRCSRCRSRESSLATRDEGNGEGGPRRFTVEQRSTCSPWKGPHARARRYLKKAVTLWGACTGAGSCQDLWTRGERSPIQSRFAGQACDPMGN